MLLELSRSIPKILAGAPDGSAEVDNSAGSRLQIPVSDDKSVIDTTDDLFPELGPRILKNARVWTTVDLVLTMDVVKLHLYDNLATTSLSLKEHGISRFALNNSTLKLKVLSDGAMEAEIVLKSVTMSNTRPGQSRFREIIPVVQHERNQFMLLYTRAGGPDPSSLAIVTIDSPQVIFSIDPVFALLDFISGPLRSDTLSYGDVEHTQGNIVSPDPLQSARLDLRLDLHDVSISVPEDDTDPNSQAVRLSISQVSISQQVA